MRILRISLRNIASLAGTHTIDFTRDPLRATGLFSISGSTGSGKSTLLDALCLALYERTPRLDGIRGAMKLPDGSDLVSQSDPANLLRRGAGEGFAEVAFIGIDNAIYTARWNVRRARNRPDGLLQKTELTLFRGDVRSGREGVIELGGKKSEVLPAIAAKVGLSFEQFTRAVLLAQNDFTTFLKADDRERAEILQALTGTERFEAISRAVFDRYSTKLKENGALEALLEINAPQGPAERAQAEEALAVAENALREATENRAAREKHAMWYRRQAELLREVAHAERSIDEAKRERNASAARRLELIHTEIVSHQARALWNEEKRTGNDAASSEKSRDQAARAEADASANFCGWKERYATATAAFNDANSAVEEAQSSLRQARDLDSRLHFLGERLAIAIRERESAEAAVKQLIDRRAGLMRERHEAQYRSFEAKRGALAWLSTFAPDAAGWIERIDRAIFVRSELTAVDREWKRWIKEEQTKTSLFKSEQEKYPILRVVAESAAFALKTAEAAAQVHDGERISIARREADGNRTALRDLQNFLVRLEWLSDRAESLENEISKLRTENEDDGRTLVELTEARIPAAEIALECARYSYELAQSAVADATICLREKLVPNLPCPVCGALEHPYASNPPATETAALRALRDDCSARERAFSSLRSQEAGLITVCQTRENQRAEKSQSLREIVSRLEEMRAVRHEHSEAASIFAMPAAERATALVDQIMAQEKIIESLDAAENARLAAERQRDSTRINRDKAVEELAVLERRLGEIATELGRIQVARESAETARNRAAETLKACLDQLAPLFASRPGIGLKRVQDEVVFRKDFCAEIAEFRALEKRTKELEMIVRECGVELVPIQEGCQRADAECKAKQTGEAAARSAYDEVRTKRTAIFNGRSADTVESELNDKLRAVTKSREECAEELARAERDFVRASQEYKATGIACEEINSERQAAVAALDAWLAAFAAEYRRALDRDALPTMLGRDDTWIRTERAALDALESEVSKAEGAFAVYEKAFEAHGAACPTTDDETTVDSDLIRLRLVQAEANLRRDATRTVLLADDQRRTTHLDLTRELENRREAFRPWVQLNELIGSADGAKFRSIAQRRTLDILLCNANVQLEQLASRYSLARVPESLNLVVIDRDMGEECRSVHTLSGGESFLVSLALALGLASLTSNRLKIESLFIDEGFGSLDPETLNTAMGALMSLEAQGRKVGVISHVSEIADAIPVQIRVIKGRNGASWLSVAGVPACSGG